MRYVYTHSQFVVTSIELSALPLHQLKMKSILPPLFSTNLLR